MPDTADVTGKDHVSLVVCGHVDSGKSTTTGRLMFELGGISQREMDKLKAKAEAAGKGSFLFAFYTDNNKEEQERGVTISCNTKEFATDTKRYSIIDAPGHRDFIKNMVKGSSQADVALLMVPANKGGFEVSIQKGNHKENEVQGQTRQHARLINLLGVEQLLVGVNKMDDPSVNFSQERYEEIKKEVARMLTLVGWKKDKVANVPFIPMSGFHGDNLLKKSDNMPWWNGAEVTNLNGDKVQVDTVYDALEKMVCFPKRDLTAAVRMPVSGVHNIKGVGTVVTGRLEQGSIKPGEEVKFIPTHTDANACAGKVFTVEMHHKSQEMAAAGDNVGLNIKGLDKTNMPRGGDVMTLKKDMSLIPLSKKNSFVCVVSVLEHPGQLRVGYTPVAYIRTATCACRITAINWKVGKSTGGVKVENPEYIETGVGAEVVFQPQAPFIAEPFNVCAGLGRVAIFEGNSVVMLGKVMKVNK